MFILTDGKGNIVGQYAEVQYIPPEQRPNVIEVAEIPTLDFSKPGKYPYYYFNGSSVEVRYQDRPLAAEEQLAQIQIQMGNILLERATDKVKIDELEGTVGLLLIEVAQIKANKGMEVM